MSAAASGWAWQRRGLTTTTKMVLLAIAESADDQNLSAVPREVVMAMTELSDTTIRRSVSELIKAQLLAEHDEVIRRDVGGGSRLVQRYLLAVDGLRVEQ